MSYTKGPWKVDGKRVYFGENPIELRSKEDALLCASAPDLLEACKRAAEHFEGTDSPLGKLLQEAISKAEGRE